MSTPDLTALLLIVLVGIAICAWLDLATLLEKLETHMADANERITAATDAIGAALTNIAADIEAIKGQVGSGAPSEEVLAALEAVGAKAQALAAENPDGN